MTTISSYNNNNNNNNNDLTNTSSLNIGYVEIERLLNHNNDTINENANKKIATTTTANTSSNLVAISRDNERLKNLIRTSNWSSNHPIRKNLWTNLLQLNNNTGDSINNNKNNKYFNSNESEYIQYLNQIFGKSRDLNVSLPEFVLCNETIPSTSSTTSLNNNTSNNNHLNYYYLNNKGKDAIKRILCVFEYLFPQVTYSPGIVSLSSLLLHYMQEHEVFSALCYLSSTKDHLIETKTNWDVTCSVFIKLIKIYCKSSYDIISKYATDSLDKIFNEWFWWIFDSLSFNYLIRIIDCYLVEGQKVLFRISLAIVQQFSKSLKNENTGNVNKNSIKNFCNTSLAFDSIERLLKSSFSIRNFKRSTIKEIFLKEEIKRKSQGVNLKTTTNIDDNNNNKNIISLQENTINENSFDLNTTPSRIFIKEMNTDILTHKMLTTIWNWIPQRLTVHQPNLLFTTREDGTSVNTLFGVLNDLEYSLVIIKTFQNEIFGAFCSGLWEERKNNKQNYFGNGETFLFSLVPQKNLYRWIGTKCKKTTSNQEFFIRVDKNKIVIGGGSQDGLAINSNLTEGTTNRCDTFDNEPLCSMNHFQIDILEVIGFGN